MRKMILPVLLGGLIRPAMVCAEPKEKDIRLLTVQGEGKAFAAPDVAVISIEVSQEGPELDPVLERVRNDMNRVLELVKKSIPEKDVRTELFQVRPKFEQDKRMNPRRVGHVVSNRITVKVRELNKTGRLLSAVMGAGATSVDGPDFEVDNREVVETEALRAATRDAREKARSVAEAAGVRLGKIRSINPQPTAWPMPRHGMMAARTMMAADSSQEPLASGEQTLTAQVMISFEID